MHPHLLFKTLTTLASALALASQIIAPNVFALNIDESVRAKLNLRASGMGGQLMSNELENAVSSSLLDQALAGKQCPAQLGGGCSAACQCGSGLSCQPGSQKCYHSPRQYLEPCSAGYSCGSGMTCMIVLGQGGVAKCWVDPPTAGYGCAPNVNRKLLKRGSQCNS